MLQLQGKKKGENAKVKELACIYTQNKRKKDEKEKKEQEELMNEKFYFTMIICLRIKFGENGLFFVHYF